LELLESQEIKGNRRRLSVAAANSATPRDPADTMLADRLNGLRQELSAHLSHRILDLRSTDQTVRMTLRGDSVWTATQGSGL
jgi:hypothetical protein